MVSSYNIFQYLWIWFPLKRIVFLYKGIFENEKRVFWDFIFFVIKKNLERLPPLKCDEDEFLSLYFLRNCKLDSVMSSFYLIVVTAGFGVL